MSASLLSWLGTSNQPASCSANLAPGTVTQGTAPAGPAGKIFTEVRGLQTDEDTGVRLEYVRTAAIDEPLMTGQTQSTGTRRVLSTCEEVRSAVVEITLQANRSLAILTPDLEPDIYDHEDFLETLKKFILARAFARVRVMITNPARAMKSGNQFVHMGRRLNSYIEFRNVKEESRDHEEAFCIADEKALVYRPDGKRWNGISDTNKPAVARQYLDTFDELWHATDIEPSVRLMHL